MFDTKRGKDGGAPELSATQSTSNLKDVKFSNYQNLEHKKDVFQCKG